MAPAKTEGDNLTDRQRTILQMIRTSVADRVPPKHPRDQGMPSGS